MKMNKVKMWTHHCKVQGTIDVALGCTCDWCGAAQSTESAYCAACGLLANELHNDLCPSCHNKVITIEVDDDPLGMEAADVNSVDGFFSDQPNRKEATA